MRLLDVVARSKQVERAVGAPAVMKFDGWDYVLGHGGSRPEQVDNDYRSIVDQVHRRHGVVAAAVAARNLLLSEIRPKWRSPDGDLFGNAALRMLEQPGGMTRPQFFATLGSDASYSGTAVVVARNERVFRLPPDKTTFVLGSDSEPAWNGDVLHPPFDAQTVAVVYRPSGTHGPMHLFGPGEFAVWAPEPDPVYFWRGTSWVSAVMQDVLLDGQATDQTSRYFENGSIPSLVFLMDPTKTPDELAAYQQLVDEKHSGVRNRYKNLFLGGATDVKVLSGALDAGALSHIQGTYENRVAVRSRVPAPILGTKESLTGSSLNAGNYSAARRMMADGWFTPTAESLCAALQPLLPAQPEGVELTYDAARILFLQEDEKDAADIAQINAVAIRQLVEAGFEPDSAVAAITTGDMSKLAHTGNVSVQLQPTGSGE